MKSTSVLAAALAFSLLVNFVLWARLEREARAAATSARVVQLASGRPPSASAGPTHAKPPGSTDTERPLRGVVWRKARTAEDWRQLADDLRAAGFPERDVRHLIERSIYLAQRDSSKLPKLPFWGQINGGKATRAEVEKVSRDSDTLRKSVFGKDGDDYVPTDPLFRNAMFGNLPDEKVQVLAKIERDYGEIYWQQRRGDEVEDALATFEGRSRIRLLEEEKERDIAAVLTPEEFEDFARRQSRAAKTVISGVSDIEVSDEEYNALYHIQRDALAAIPREAGPEEALAYARNSAAAAEEVRTVLGDDRFYSYMANTDPLYSAAAKFAKTNPGLTPATTHALYQLQLEAMTALARTTGAERTSDLANHPDGRAALAPFAAKLDALLGPQLAAAYRKTPQGKIFPADGDP